MGILRILLAFAVLDSHVVEHVSRAGFSGIGFVQDFRAVQLFFVVSGFYMALVLHEKYNLPRGWRLFLQQRFLRLYPTYFFILVFFLALYGLLYFATGKLFGAIALWHDYPHLLSGWSILLYGWVNAGVVGQDLVLFFRQDIITGQFYFAQPPPGSTSLWSLAFIVNPPAWSLSTEWMFYCLAPWLVYRSTRVQLGVWAASVVLVHILFYAQAEPIRCWIDYFPPSELCYFVTGSLLYRFYRKYSAGLTAFGTANRWIFWLAIPLAVFYRRIPLLGDQTLGVVFIGAAMVPLLYAFTRRSHLDRMIGELSYPFYLFHWNLIYLMESLPGSGNPSYFELLCFLSTLVCSVLFYYFIESRTERWRARVFERAMSNRMKEAKAGESTLSASSPAQPRDSRSSTR